MTAGTEKRYILFSPVGGTDPISNCRDGSMLHITRKYKPEKVMLYLSAEMLEHHNNDDRYRECLNRLQESENFKIDEIIIEAREKLDEVQKFEIFFGEFEPLLKSFHNDNPDCEVLLNVSSGTPAMKSSLFMLAPFLPFNVTLIQTSTPEKKQNPRSEKVVDYDIDLYWDTNLDGDKTTYADRCEESSNINLVYKIERDNIEALLATYDYAAALKIANSMRELLNPAAIALLEAAKMRSELNTDGIKSQKIKKLFKIDNAENNGLFDISEYLLWLKMKYDRGDYSDYLRAITPALFELMKLAVEVIESFPVTNTLCDERNTIIRDKLLNSHTGKKLLKIWQDNNYGRDPSKIGSNEYDLIIKSEYNNKPWARYLRNLRGVEAHIRNPLAHTITRIDKNWLESQLCKENEGNQGYYPQINTIAGVQVSFERAVKAINDCLPKTDVLNLNVNWEAYDQMNDLIKKALDKPCQG